MKQGHESWTFECAPVPVRISDGSLMLRSIRIFTATLAAWRCVGRVARRLATPIISLRAATRCIRASAEESRRTATARGNGGRRCRCRAISRAQSSSVTRYTSSAEARHPKRATPRSAARSSSDSALPADRAAPVRASGRDPARDVSSTRRARWRGRDGPATPSRWHPGGAAGCLRPTPPPRAVLPGRARVSGA